MKNLLIYPLEYDHKGIVLLLWIPPWTNDVCDKIKYTEIYATFDGNHA